MTHGTIASGGTVQISRWAPVEAPQHDTGEPQPRFLHVAEQGTLLRKIGHRIQVTKNDKILLEVPTIKLRGILLYGNAHLSTQCTRLALEDGIWVSFLTRTGQYRGRLQPPSERGAELRRLQYERTRDAEFCLRWSKSVVRAKLVGAREVAAAYSRNYLAETLGEGHMALRRGLEGVERATSIEELRGVEGTAARAYWGLFQRWNRSEFVFPGRVKRGAADPVNILLNLAYTMLTRELEGLIESAGLDPAVGYYHAPEGDRPSLACDWVEEFRHMIADRLVLSLLNRQQVKAGDFDLRDEKRGARLGPTGLRTFLGEYEKTMTGGLAVAAVAGVDGGPGRGHRAVMLGQLGRMMDALRGEGGAYRSYWEATEAACST